MSNHDAGKRVVAAFKKRLTPQALSTISESEWSELSLMVAEAVSEEMNGVAERLDEFAKQLRAATTDQGLAM